MNTKSRSELIATHYYIIAQSKAASTTQRNVTIGHLQSNHKGPYYYINCGMVLIGMQAGKNSPSDIESDRESI